MSITPVGGWGVQPPGQVQYLAAQRGVCPLCHSDDWKSANLIYAEGLSTNRSASKGSAFGIGRTSLRNGQFQVGVASYSGRSHGASQTLLSSMATPPQERRGLTAFLAMLMFAFGWAAIAIFSTNGLNQGSIICSLLAVSILFPLLKLRDRQQRIYKEALDAYTHTRMCQRCGTFYRPT